MPNNSERFRNEFSSQLLSLLSPEQVHDVLTAFDVTSSNYEISAKPTEIIVAGGIPEVVKWFIASKSVQNCSMGTLKQYRYKLIDFFSTVRKPFQDITTTDIRLYLANFKQARSVSDRYLECIRVTLNTFFDWLVDNEYLLRNPCAKIEHIRFQEKPRSPLSAYELEVLRWNCQDIREKALVDFLFSTGCRVSECAAVKLSDIDWVSRSVCIRHGKGDKQRTVYFNAESELTLREYLKTRSDNCDGLFISVRGAKTIGPHAIQDILKKISSRAGMHVYPHKLRHTFATSGLRGGMPLEKLQALMGHTKPQTTMIYAKLDQVDLQLEHRRIYA